MITITVNEEGALVLDIVFTDDEGIEHDLSAVVSVNWQLSDVDGNVVNDRSFANGLITASPVVLNGDDTATGSNGDCRKFTVKIVYDSSTHGANLNANEEITFDINNLVNI